MNELLWFFYQCLLRKCQFKSTPCTFHNTWNVMCITFIFRKNLSFFTWPCIYTPSCNCVSSADKKPLVLQLVLLFNFQTFWLLKEVRYVHTFINFQACIQIKTYKWWITFWINNNLILVMAVFYTIKWSFFFSFVITLFMFMHKYIFYLYEMVLF